MGVTLSPEQLQELSREVTQTGQKAKKQAEADKLRAKFNFEPPPGTNQPKQVDVVFPATRVTITDDPDNNVFGFDVTRKKDGLPVNIEGINGMKNGRAVLNPNEVGPALETVGKARVNQTAPMSSVAISRIR